ncbi:PH domain-containing protein [Streptomyces sp. N35]|uniref:PH domain-containing protein n=1 Tax=Streptomyces sp. N35 TaxID=2795730 RepID=UPI0018F5396D|nr:PH domain-containing protein [Streptomyces sp. N35]
MLTGRKRVIRAVGRRGSSTITLQRRSGPILGAIGVGVMVVMLALMPTSMSKNSSTDTVVLALALVSFARLIWRALGRPRVVIHKSGLQIIGLFDRFWVPLKSVRGVDTSHGLRIRIDGDDDVSVFAFSNSLIDRGRTVEAAAAEIRKALVVRRDDQGHCVKRQIDWTWWDVAVIPLPMLMIAGVFGWI